MIKTVRLATYELRRFKGPLPIIALLFLLLIPTLSGALYLWSTWDPYGKLDQVPVAVVNQDVPVQVEGRTVAAGDRLVAELQADPIFDWQFVDEAEAEQGLAEGNYYMIVEIPPDFSENLVSGAGADPTRAVVQLILNDANGYLSDVLVLSAQTRLEAAIDRAAAGAYFEAVFANLDTIKVGVTAAATTATSLATAADAALVGATDQATGITTAKDLSVQQVAGLADIKVSSTELVTTSGDAKAGSASLVTGLSTLETSSSQTSSTAADVASTSQQLAGSIGPATSSVNAAVGPLGQASADLPVISENLTTISENLTTIAATPNLDPAIALAINTAAGQVATSSSQTNSAAGQVSSASNSVDSAASDLSSANSDASAVATGAAQVSTGMDAISTGISTASSGASTVDSSIITLSAGATDLDARIGALQLGAQQLDDGLGTLVTNSAPLVDGITQLDAGINQLATDLVAAADRIPTIAPDVAQGSEQVLSAPADVEVTIDNPATVYGRGLAPFLFAIAVWILGTAAFLVLRPISSRALAGRASSWRISMAGWLPVFGLGALGSLLLLGVVWLGLRLDPVNAGGAIGVILLTAATFTAIAHLLRTWLGAAGSALMLVLLMVQLTSAGGLYPVETLPVPFRAIHDFIPMTYVVDALRITFSGGQIDNLWRDVAVLAGFLIVAIGLTIFVVHRRRRFRVRDLHPVLVQ